MDSNLKSVIIGAIIGALPSIISSLASSSQNKASLKHDLRRMDIEIYHKEKIEALKNYRLALRKACENVNIREPITKFTTASDILDMMVSESTHEILYKVYGIIMQAHTQSLAGSGFPPVPHYLDEHTERELLSALRFEMDLLHRSSGLGGMSFEICSSSTPSDPAGKTPQEQGNNASG